MHLKNSSLIIFCILLFSSHVFSEEKKYVFTGNTISDDNSGITIMSNDSKEIDIVTNFIYHYAIVIPHSNKWEFTINTNNYLIFGTSGNINVSLKLSNNKHNDSKKHLLELNKMYISDKSRYGIIDTKLLEHKGFFVLKTIVDPNIVLKNNLFNDYFQYNYFSSKFYNNLQYDYHISILLKKNDSFSEINFLNYSTVGFNIDFQRK